MANISYKNYRNNNDFFSKSLEVVFYARASTKKLEQYFSIQDQIEANKSFINRYENWKLIDEYVEQKSGRSIKRRKEFQRLIEDAKAGKFQLIIVRDTSRFARNLKDAIVTIDELKEYGVAVYYVFENIYSLNADDYQRLVYMSLNAQMESDRKKDYTEMSIKFRKDAGIPFLSPKVTGYKFVKTDKKQPNTYEYNELSRLIAEIFFMYKGSPLEKPEGIETMPNITQEWLDTIYSDKFHPYNPDKSLSLKKISIELNRIGVSTVFNSKYWHTSTISSILHKVVYTGYFMYDLYEYDDRQDRYVKKLDVDLGISVTDNGQIIDVEGVLYKGDWLPIITLRDWLEIQNAMRGNRLFDFKEGFEHPTKGIGKKPSSDIFIRRMRCSRCGATYNRSRSRSNNPNLIKPVYLFECTHRRNFGTVEETQDYKINPQLSCSSKSFERVKLDYATIRVFDLLFGDLKEAAELAYQMIVENYVSQGVIQTERKSDIISKELATVNKNIGKVQQDFANAEMEYEDFKAVMQKLKERKQILERQRADALMQEGKTLPIKDDVFAHIKEALDSIYTIDESIMEVDADLISAFLVKLLADVTDEHFRLTYFLDLTGEAYKYENISFNCFDENYRDNYELPKDYTVFHSFTITKAEADLYAKSLNKRAFKSNIWNDIEVEIVLDYKP